MQTIDKNYKNELHAIVRDIYPQLQKFREQQDREAFNYTLEKILPGLKKYINRWLNNAISNEKIPVGKYKVEDFVDELYILAFDHFQEVKTDSDLHSWLFKKADELLEDTEIEEDFNNFFFKNLEDYTHEEWESMEEKITRDADGDLVLEEEIDDPSYTKDDYTLENVFVENLEEEWLKKLSDELNPAQIRKHILLVANHLPYPMSSIFELNISHGFTPAEIAGIKKITIQQVNKNLVEARKWIRLTFEKRYFE